MLVPRRLFLGAAASLVPLRSQVQPWYRRTYRWGQTNITEADPARYDIGWWREHWKRTAVQGVILNAGGIFAYYPSRLPLQHRAAGDRDLFGELARAAHADGLVVLARMDSNRAHEPFFRAHPDWFARDAEGRPFVNNGLYAACVNSPYYDEYLPAVLREIIARERPEGFTDNSWSGLERDQICYCEHCARKFQAKAGSALPKRPDYADPVYRAWIRWNYERRLEIWDLNNRVTKAAGGQDCLWLGMTHGSIASQCRKFRDYRAICRRSEIVMLDYQSRGAQDGFSHNAEMGQLLHELLGWEKLIPESMPMYQMGRPTFRVASKPAAEARMWAVSGMAGGIQPWWHHIGAWHEDKRMYETAAPLWQWHKANERYLMNRRPLADVGLVWSQENAEWFGRNDAERLVDQPFRGWAHAMIRARIPYLPVHADDIARTGCRVLVLPNLGIVSAAQAKALEEFVRRGGSLIITGAASGFDDEGDPRDEFLLASLMGVRKHEAAAPARETRHTYLRIESRHPVLAGFDGTAILPFGGELKPLDTTGAVLLTFIPPFPMYPPETSWMREPKTAIPALIVREQGKSRLAFMPADIDRQYAIHHLPDHARLLANLVRWTLNGGTGFEVTGRGLIDCRVYEQGGRRIVHFLNLSAGSQWGEPLEEVEPIGPFRVSLPAPRASSCRLLVAGTAVPVRFRQGLARFEIARLEEHEVAVIE